MKAKIKAATLLVVIFLYFAAAAHAAGTIRAFLDRNRVSLGETVQLTIQAKGRLSGDLDTSPLEKDFHVLGTSSGSSINVVNGSMNSSKTWRITLAPKRKGTLAIPSLEVGGQHTKPQSLIVADSPAPRTGSAPDTGSLSPPTPTSASKSGRVTAAPVGVSTYGSETHSRAA